MEDLRKASAQLKDLGVEDARVEAEIGHLLLVRQEQRQRLPSFGRPLPWRRITPRSGATWVWP